MTEYQLGDVVQTTKRPTFLHPDVGAIGTVVAHDTMYGVGQIVTIKVPGSETLYVYDAKYVEKIPWLTDEHKPDGTHTDGPGVE